MNAGIFELLLLLPLVVIALALFGLWVWAIADAAKLPDARWEVAGTSKALWIVLIVVLGGLGALIYVVAIRPKVVGAGRGTSAAL